MVSTFEETTGIQVTITYTRTNSTFEKSPVFLLYATFQPTTMEFNLSKPNRKIHAGVILTKG